MSTSDDSSPPCNTVPSAELLLQILSSAADHIYAFDCDGRFLYCNETGARALGRSAKSTIGKTGIEIGAPRDLMGRFDRERATVWLSARPFTGHVNYPTPKGLHEFEYTFSPVLSDSEEVTAIVFVGRDIHQRNLELQALRQSEARFTALFQNSHDAIGVASEDKHVFVNYAYVKMYGFQRKEELIGTPVLDRIAVTERDLIAKRMWRRAHGEIEPDTYEMKCVRADGSTFDVENRVTLIDWEQQQVTLVIQREITEFKSTINALRESDARYSAIIACALDSVITIDDNECILEWNAAAETTFGYLRKDVIGCKLSNLIIPPELRSAHAIGIAHFLKTGEGPVLNKRVEVTAMRSDGSMFPAELTAMPIKLGGKYAFTAYVRDISDRKAAAKQQRMMLKDVLASVTDGRLRLCTSVDELPDPMVPLGDSIQINDSLNLRTLRYAVTSAATALGFELTRLQDLVTGASEAAMNALVHAGSGIARIYTDDSQTIQVWVEDSGTGIQVEDLPHATLQRGWSSAGTLGHGMKMILRTCDRIYLLTGAEGTTVVIEQDKIGTPVDW